MTRYVGSLAAVATVAFSGCSTIPSDDNIGDIVAVGTLENLSYESTNDPADMLGHGMMTGRFHVTRVVRGNLAERVVAVRYFGHTYFAEDMKHEFRLRLDKGGPGYVICAPPNGVGIQCD